METLTLLSVQQAPKMLGVVPRRCGRVRIPDRSSASWRGREGTGSSHPRPWRHFGKRIGFDKKIAGFTLGPITGVAGDH
jgi:hypothetical protein